jgi:hypothetical protein
MSPFLPVGDHVARFRGGERVSCRLDRPRTRLLVEAATDSVLVARLRAGAP